MVALFVSLSRRVFLSSMFSEVVFVFAKSTLVITEVDEPVSRSGSCLMYSLPRTKELPTQEVSSPLARALIVDPAPDLLAYLLRNHLIPL